MEDKCKPGYKLKNGECEKVNNKSSGKSSSLPFGVNFITIFMIIFSVIEILIGILITLGGLFLGSFLTDIPILGDFGTYFTIGAVIIGIGIIIFAIIQWILAIALRKGSNGARIFYIIWLILSIILSVIGIFMGSETTSSIILGIGGIILNLFILFYMVFDNDVKEYFS